MTRITGCRSEKGDPMTVVQAWILVVEVGVVALAALIGLLRK
jgi:hypothetical protein